MLPRAFTASSVGLGASCCAIAGSAARQAAAAARPNTFMRKLPSTGAARYRTSLVVASKFHLETALTPDGWRDDVVIRIERGMIVGIEAPGHGPAERISGITVPGVPNLHSHALQRAMAGLTERGGTEGGGEADSFWSWREAMYRFVERLSPDDLEAIAAFAYMEMLEAGFTSVAEFHYLHHQPDGRPYANPAEMSERIVAAADTVRIGLTLLPVSYPPAGFGGPAPTRGHRRSLC